MEAAPDGTAVRAFLFADIRGYTAFTHERGDEVGARLAARFAELAYEVVGAHGGEVTELRGDEALSVFSSPRAALRAAVALQSRFLQEQESYPDLPLKVGMGLDAGEAVPVAGGYRGGALNLAARLCATAGPGEVFGSEGIIHLARSVDDLTYVDRGELMLKGLPTPVRVFQVTLKDAALSDAPRFTAGHVQPVVIPAQPTPFLGRSRELGAITAILQNSNVHLLTLTGPGGTGKTRLALAAADAVKFAFPDGVYFVPLASVTNPDLVPAAVARTLGLVGGGTTPEEQLRERLREKRTLLVLDTMEHLLDSGVWLAELLAECSRLVILVTSREILRLAAEHDYAVPPLALPEGTRLPGVPELSQYDAIALFMERARAAKAGFALTEENAAAVAEICTRLDGLPLALELAAARIRLFPPAALLKRLGERLALLTGGARDLPSRQQTLRGAIDWSYSLLNDEEAQLFARLSIFVGGCTFESAEAVCSPEGDVDVLEALGSLVEKSLVVQSGDEEPRLRMLDTIREYAAERLQNSGKAEELAGAHAEHFHALAEAARPALFGPEQREWIDRLRAEEPNCWAAIEYFLRVRDAEMALTMVLSLSYYWYLFGYFTQGRRIVGAVLEIGGDLPESLRILALDSAAHMARNQNDLDVADDLSRMALDRARTHDDRNAVTSVLSTRALVFKEQSRHAEAHQLLEEALAIAREENRPESIGGLLVLRGDVAMGEGQIEDAIQCYEEGVTRQRALGDEIRAAYGMSRLAIAVGVRGDMHRTRSILLEVLRMVMDQAAFTQGIVGTLADLAWVSASLREANRAVRLAGAVTTLRDVTGIPAFRDDRERYEQGLDATRAMLDEGEWEALWDAGRGMTQEEAVAFALEDAEFGHAPTDKTA